MQTQLLTYRDVIDRCLDYVGAATDPLTERKARSAIQSAVNAFWSMKTWNILYRRGRIITSPPYSTGTITYSAATKQATLSGGVWPAWAADGMLSFGQSPPGLIPYPVSSRVSGTVLQLASSTAGNVDVTTPSTYTLYQESYPLPVDFGTAGDVVNMGFARVMFYQTPDEFIREQRVNISPANPFMYTFQNDQRRYGGLVISFYPGPDAAYTMDFSYRRQLRPLQVVGESGGTASITSGFATMQGNATLWTPQMVGSVVRFAAAPIADVPTGLGGASPFYLQRTITGFTDPETLTLDQDPQVTLAAVPYIISDPVDIDYGSMMDFFLSECEFQMRRLFRMESTKFEEAYYSKAKQAAFEADAVHYESRSTFSGSMSIIRIASFPHGADIS